MMPINKKINHIFTDLYHSLSYLQNNSFLQLWYQDKKTMKTNDNDKEEKRLYQSENCIY